jgi:hypothetical protein
MGETKLQRETCARFDTGFVEARDESTLGVARATLNLVPLNGLRHRAQPGTCGWFVWGGEMHSNASDFFSPMHVAHLNERCPGVLKYLGLGPGWRFLIAPGYEDVWFDESLLHA